MFVNNILIFNMRMKNHIEVESELVKKEMPEIKTASKTIRHIATIIDVLIISLVFYIDENYRKGEFTNGMAISLIIVYLIYSILLTIYSGKTFGQYILNLKTIDSESYQIPTPKKIIARELLSLTAMTGIGYLFFSLGHGVYWDRITKTTVVKNQKKVNLKILMSNMTLDKFLKLAIIAGILLTAVYFFLFKPLMQKKE